MASRYMKRCSTSKKCKLKPQWDVILHLSEWLSSINQKTSVDEGVDKREPSCTVGGNENWYSHYGEQYGGFSKN